MRANQEVIGRIKRGQAVLAGMGIAREVIPGMHAHMLLHAGPPITWDRMCGPQRGAVMGALIYEGLAGDEPEAARLAASGEIEFSPCHHHHAVGPMAGVVSASMPVFILENKAFGNRAYCTQNEGLGKVLRYGGMGAEVTARLKWMETDLYPALDRALQSLPDGVDIKSLIAQALHMGDECHNRNRAATSLFLRAIAPALARTSRDNEQLARVIEFIDRNDHFFLNLSMPTGKAMLEPAEGVRAAPSSPSWRATAPISASAWAACPDRWFTAPPGSCRGCTSRASAPRMPTPTSATAPSPRRLVTAGWPWPPRPPSSSSSAAARRWPPAPPWRCTRSPPASTSSSPSPPSISAARPLGIDVRKVMETGILPQINTGIAHKEPGIGMVGAGILRAPEQCFKDAFDALKDL